MFIAKLFSNKNHFVTAALAITAVLGVVCYYHHNNNDGRAKLIEPPVPFSEQFKAEVPAADNDEREDEHVQSDKEDDEYFSS